MKFKTIIPKRVLITCPHNLGDLVAKIPALRLLKEHYPKCELWIMVRPYIMDLAKSLNLFDEVLDFESFFNRASEAIVKDLKSFQIDTLVHLLSVAAKQGPDVVAFANEAKIPYRIGNYKRSRATLFKTKNMGLTHNLRVDRIIKDKHEFEWNLLFLQFFGIDTSLSIDQMDPYLNTSIEIQPTINQYLKPDRFNLIIHPGSNGNAKEWPEQSYIELIKSLDTNKFNILLTGSQSEAYRFHKLGKQHVTNLMGKLSLKELLSLIEKSDGIIAASTGPLHLASLFSKKTLGLFAFQENIGPKVWAPVGKNAGYLQSSSVCSACTNKLTDFNHFLCKCMEKIDANTVYKKVLLWQKT